MPENQPEKATTITQLQRNAFEVKFPHTIPCEIDRRNRTAEIGRMEIILTDERYYISGGWRVKIGLLSGIDTRVTLIDTLHLSEIQPKIKCPIGPYQATKISKDVIESEDGWKLELYIVDSFGSEECIFQSKEVSFIEQKNQTDDTASIYKETSSGDPTTQLPTKPTNLPAFRASHEIKMYFENLEKERVIVITCLDEEALLSAAYALIDQAESKDIYEKRMLAFEGENIERSDLQLDLFINTEFNETKKSIIIIDVTLQRFFDSVFLKDRLYAERIKEVLKQRGLVLICLVKSEVMQKRLEDTQTSFYFLHWHLPFLRFLLEQNFPEVRARDLENKIMELRQFGVWEQYNSDSEFHELVSGYLRTGAEEFEEQIEDCYVASQNKDKSEFLNRKLLIETIKPSNSIETIKSSALFKSEKVLEGMVLYTATFFQYLIFRDFEQILLLLLKGQTVTVNVESEITTEDGEKKMVKTEVERDAIEVWESDSDAILKSCCLRMMTMDNSVRVIDFTHPHLRREMKKHLEQEYPVYLRQQFKRIQEAGLLFNPQASSHVIENVMRLSVEMTLTDPDYYGRQWFLGVVIGLERELDTGSAPSTEFEQMLQLIARHEGDKIRGQFFSRMSDLIREMLNYPQLQDMISTFLGNLIETRHHDAVFEIVLEIARRLQFAPQFDALYWMKRLFDQGHREIPAKTYSALHERAMHSGLRIYELLDTIKTWLPEPGRNPDQYSRSNRYSLMFLIDYCRGTALALSRSNYGKWPSKYPLFATQEVEGGLSESLKDVLSWLFHPGMKEIYEDNIITLLRADLIELWFLILNGIKKDSALENPVTLIDFVLKTIVSVTDRTEQKAILDYWKAKRNAYLTEIGNLDYTNRSGKEQLRTNRRVLRELAKKFRTLHRQSPRRSKRGGK